jgi:hypothetical protein
MSVAKLTEEEFESFEETIASSAKGRAFLREHARRQRIISTDDVKRVVYKIRDDLEARDMGGSGGGGGAAQNRLDVLRAELHDMAASIVETKRQIAALQPKEAGKNRIMAATGELDAIVSATERATSEIIAQAELLLSVGEEIRESGAAALSERVDEIGTNILMACSFQDITGQRTNKVVNAMRYLEHRINAMVSIWGGEDFASNGDVDPEEDDDLIDRRPDAHLLNGPSADGVGQDDIDALFAGDSFSPVIDEAPPPPPPPPPKPAAVSPAPPPAAKAPPKPPAKAAPPKAPEPVGGGASMAQDDIDSLFS